MKLTGCWLAAPTHAKTPAPTPLSTRTTKATTSRATEPRCAGQRSGQKEVEPAAGLLRTCGGELPGADESDQDRQEEKTYAEHGLGAGSRCSELGEHLMDRRTRYRAPGRFGDQAVQPPRNGDGHPPANDSRSDHPYRQAHRSGEEA